MNKQQLEIDHCHAVCDELRAKLNTCVADTLEREANEVLGLIDLLGRDWTNSEKRLVRRIGSTMKNRAALARTKAGVW